MINWKGLRSLEFALHFSRAVECFCRELKWFGGRSRPLAWFLSNRHCGNLYSPGISTGQQAIWQIHDPSGSAGSGREQLGAAQAPKPVVQKFLQKL